MAEESLQDKLKKEFDGKLEDYLKYQKREEQEKRLGAVNQGHFEGYKSATELYEKLKKDKKLPKRGKPVKDEHINDILESYLLSFIEHAEHNDKHKEGNKWIIDNYKKTKFDTEDKRLAKLKEIYSHFGLHDDRGGGVASKLISALKENDFETFYKIFDADFMNKATQSYLESHETRHFHSTIGDNKFHQKGFAKHAIEKIGDGRYSPDLDKDGKGKIHGYEVAHLKGIIDKAANSEYIEDKKALEKIGIKYNSPKPKK